MAAGRSADRQARVHHARRPVVDHGDRVVRVDRGRPAGDRAALAGEDEDAGPGHAVLRDVEVRLRVEHDAGGMRQAGRAGRNRHHQRLRHTVAVVERRARRALVGDPDEGLGVESDAPGVDQMGIGVGADVGRWGGGVGNQVGHGIAGRADAAGDSATGRSVAGRAVTAATSGQRQGCRAGQPTQGGEGRGHSCLLWNSKIAAHASSNGGLCMPARA